MEYIRGDKMAIITFWRRIFDFGGTSRRGEFWLGYLVNLFLVGGVVAFLIEKDSIISLIIGSILAIALVIGILSARVRRLRDSGRGWGWIFIPLIPSIGGIVLFILLLMPSKY